jgi:hypothetical protein
MNSVPLTTADSFTAILVGNNMIPITLNTTGDTRSIAFSLYP